jgi:Na+(H+)/acetate symporter ActP
MKNCLDCEHFKRKEILSKNNKVVKKNFCDYFKQGLSNLNSCKRYDEKERIFVMFLVISVSLGIAGFIFFLIEFFTKGWVLSSKISLLVALVSLIAFLILFYVDERMEKK